MAGKAEAEALIREGRWLVSIDNRSYVEETRLRTIQRQLDGLLRCEACRESHHAGCPHRSVVRPKSPCCCLLDFQTLAEKLAASNEHVGPTEGETDG